MKITTYTTTGTKEGEIELPIIFSTPFRRELIHKAWTNLTSHKFQPQGRHPSAGQDVVALGCLPCGWNLCDVRLVQAL